MPLDINYMCRLCMSHQHTPLFNIFTDDTDDMYPLPPSQYPLSVRIEECLSREVKSSDHLPKYICLKCIFLVNRFYAFKESCKEAIFRTEAIIRVTKNGSSEVANGHIEDERPILLIRKHPSSCEENAVDPLALPDEIVVDESDNEVIEIPSSKAEESSGQQQPHNGLVEERIVPKHSKTYSNKSLLGVHVNPTILVDNVAHSVHKQANLSTALELSKHLFSVPAPSRASSPSATQVSEDSRKKIKTLPQAIGVAGPSSAVDDTIIIEGNGGHTSPEIQNKLFQNGSLDISATDSNSTTGKFGCSFCYRRFSHKSSLRRHEATHFVKVPFECQYCSRSFLDNSDLIRHECTHIVLRDLHCPHCKKSYKDEPSLKLHVARKHPRAQKKIAQNVHECGQCSLKFTNISELDRHMDQHISDNFDSTSGGSIICELCFSNFPDNNSLVRHKTSFHTKPKYQCDLCPESFMLKKKYEKHVNTIHDPSPHSCKVCGMTFTNEYTCRMHERTHARSRLNNPFTSPANLQCEMCGSEFNSMFSLLIHKETCNKMIIDDELVVLD